MAEELRKKFVIKRLSHDHKFCWHAGCRQARDCKSTKVDHPFEASSAKGGPLGFRLPGASQIQVTECAALQDCFAQLGSNNTYQRSQNAMSLVENGEPP